MLSEYKKYFFIKVAQQTLIFPAPAACRADGPSSERGTSLRFQAARTVSEQFA
jgi:hypothetical protein